jgi:hypothetical protein
MTLLFEVLLYAPVSLLIFPTDVPDDGNEAAP